MKMTYMQWLLKVSSVPDGVEGAEKLDVGHVKGAAWMNQLHKANQQHCHRLHIVAMLLTHCYTNLHIRAVKCQTSKTGSE